MKTKLLAAVMAICIVFSLMPVTALAEGEEASLGVSAIVNKSDTDSADIKIWPLKNDAPADDSVSYYYEAGKDVTALTGVPTVDFTATDCPYEKIENNSVADETSITASIKATGNDVVNVIAVVEDSATSEIVGWGTTTVSWLVSFDANGGKFDTDDGSFGTAADGGVILPDWTPSAVDVTREGYFLSGWSLTPGGEAITIPETGYPVTANITLYAVWTEGERILYDIKASIADPSTGTVSFSVDGNIVADAAAGEIVTVIAEPEPGYEVDTITVKGEGVDINVTDNNTFVMPDKEVIVGVAFKLRAYTLNVICKAEDGSFTTNPANDALTELHVNDTVTITVTPETGKQVTSMLVNGKEIDLTSGDNGAKSCTVTMPAANVTVNVNFADANAVKRNVIPDTSDEGVQIIDVAPADVYAGNTVTVTPHANTGYEITDVIVTNNGEALQLNKNDDGTTWSFVMPDADVTVKAVAGKLYAVEIADHPNGNVSLNPATETSFLEDYPVGIVAIPDEGYELDKIEVKTISGTAVEVDENHTFKMPASDVRVTVTFKKGEYTVNIINNGGGNVAVDKPKAQMGETVTITLTPDTGYIVTGVKVVTKTGDSVETTPTGSNTHTFTMPADDVDVSIAFDKLRTITVTQTTGGTISVNPPSTATVGTEVVVTVAPDTANDYKFVTLKVETLNGELNWTDGTAPNTYTFIMPDEDVKVSATFAKVDVDTGVTEVDMTGVDIADGVAVNETELKDALDTSKIDGLVQDDISTIVTKAVESAPEGAKIDVVVSLNITAAEVTASEIKLNITPTYTVTINDVEGIPQTIQEFDQPVSIKIGVPDIFAAVKAALHYDGTKIIERLPVEVTGAEGAMVATFTAKSFSPYVLTTDEQELTVQYFNTEGTTQDGEDVKYTLGASPVQNLKANDDGWATKPNGLRVYAGGAAVDTALFNELYDLKGEDAVLKLYKARRPANSAVTVTTPEHGTVTLKVDGAAIGANVEEGKIVTITATPDSGYELDSIKVTKADNSEVTVTNGQFTMPGEAVTVTVTFKKTSSGGGGSNGGGVPVKPDDPDDPVTPGTGFTDVPADAYYAEAVKWAVEKGITQGTGDDTFSPNMVCSRSQVVTFLWRAAGSPKATGSNPFTDINPGDYYYDAVLWAVENGITQGTGDGTFSPEQDCTRAQIVTFLWRYAGEPQSANGSFSDVSSDSYYAGAVNWAVEKEITLGTGDNQFSPDMDCSRAQVVTFLYRDLAE